MHATITPMHTTRPKGQPPKKPKGAPNRKKERQKERSSRNPDSNWGPSHYKCDALTTLLFRRCMVVARPSFGTYTLGTTGGWQTREWPHAASTVGTSASAVPCSRTLRLLRRNKSFVVGSEQTPEAATGWGVVQPCPCVHTLISGGHVPHVLLSCHESEAPAVPVTAPCVSLPGAGHLLQTSTSQPCAGPLRQHTGNEHVSEHCSAR
jgi:hypothetical protein